jgi:glycerol-3-phosphate acyltransferase PlsX
MRVALDAMGGDHAPGPIVAGAVQAVTAKPHLHVVLVGDRERVEPLLDGAAGRERLEVFHCTQAVGMDESPVEGLRRKPDNSITRCWQLLAERKVDAIVGAGNTGAMVAGGLRLKRFLAGVRRPGIAAVMPTLRGPCVVLDVGANVAPKPQDLFQYGLMGEVYAKYLLGKERPTVGLMNVGEEEGKGHDLARDAFGLLSSALKERFVGNVEGRDIHRGKCDVVVCDGFVGNVVLKLSEGVFEFVMKMVTQELAGALDGEKGKALAVLQNLVKRYDYHETGGADLLGIDGICIICHGSSRERAIFNALAVAEKHSAARVNERIVEEIAALTPAGVVE